MIIAVDGDGVVEVMLAGVEMLWIGIPPRVEEHFVENDVSEEYACSVLFAGPPRRERVKALAILIRDVGELVGTITNWNCFLELFIVSWFERVLESDHDL